MPAMATAVPSPSVSIVTVVAVVTMPAAEPQVNRRGWGINRRRSIDYGRGRRINHGRRGSIDRRRSLVDYRGWSNDRSRDR